MSNRLLILGIVLGGSAVPLFATEGPKPSKTVGTKTVRLLLSKDYKTRQQAKQQILQERKNMTSELSAIVADPENHVYRPESVRNAMLCLGQLRALEGIEVLVTYIGFPWVHHPDAGEYPGPRGGGKNKPPLKGSPEASKWLKQQCPAVPALINIGEPCIDAVIGKLSTTENFEHRLCTLVLKELQQHPSVREKLQQAIQKALPPERAALQKALKALDEQPVSQEK